jgi:hypothetical protein
VEVPAIEEDAESVGLEGTREGLHTLAVTPVVTEEDVVPEADVGGGGGVSRHSCGP